MGSTALLLGWMNPPIEGMSLTAEELTGIAQRSVRDELLVAPMEWREVWVVSAPSQEVLLAAGISASPAHFTIDRWGRSKPTPRWIRQQIDAATGPAIRIDVALSERRTSPSAQQWEGLGVLVRTLNATLSRDGNTLTVRLDPALSAWSTAQQNTPTPPLENRPRTG